MESDAGARDVLHDIVLADGEVVEIRGANASGQEGPLATLFHVGPQTNRHRLLDRDGGRLRTAEICRITRRRLPILRAVRAEGDERAVGSAAG